MSVQADPFRLSRFAEAQASVYDDVVAELRRGRKRTHWMWFIFPQIEGLGHSQMAMEFAISSLEEAAAYLEHPVLGARLLECTRLVLEVKGRSITEIFGSPDDMKFRSSMTLFSAAAPAEPLFRQAMDKYFAGEPDRLTLMRI